MRKLIWALVALCGCVAPADFEALRERVAVIDQAQDEWHAVRVPEGVAVVHSGGNTLLAGHNHLDPFVNLYCPGDCRALIQGAAVAFRSAQAKARQQQEVTDVRRPGEEE